MGCCRLKFLHMLQPSKCIFSRIWGAGRPQVGLCPIFLVLFISPQVLRAPAADCRKILPHDQHVTEFYNTSPKIRELFPTKDFGNQKRAKFGAILHNFALCL